MAEATNIEWADSTFNPWIGCTKISPACDNCYAAALDKRTGGDHWGNVPRRRTSAQNWNQPRRWQRQAKSFYAEHGRRRRVFCASMADVFDNQVDPAWRDDLWALIRDCPDLDWLLLTKRPQNIAKMKPVFWDDVRASIWLGTTVEDEARAEKNIQHLIEHDSAVRFISNEPMLGAIRTDFWLKAHRFYLSSICEELYPIDWWICGGESGPNARPMHPEWVRDVRDACAEAAVPFLFKQWGEWTPGENVERQKGTIRVASYWNDQWHESRENLSATDGHIDDEPDVYRVGKKEAGRMLDGVEHNGFPVVAT